MRETEALTERYLRYIRMRGMTIRKRVAFSHWKSQSEESRHTEKETKAEYRDRGEGEAQL